MNIVKTDNSISYLNDEGKEVARIDFPKTDENTICITHTFVDESLRGMNIGSKLVEGVLEYADEHHLKITATCSYAQYYFSKHPNTDYIG